MRFLYYIAISLLLINCNNATEYNEDNYSHLIDLKNPPVISFEESQYDFGTIIEGELVEYKFEFTNTGKGSLIISDVSASCGCTIPKNWSKTPIKPGDSGYIEVIFNSKNKIGKSPKIITISANTKPNFTQVSLTGEVVGPKN